MKAIVIERDYKGIYERFALTPEEFKEEYPGIINIATQDSYTISSMVHIWYCPCDIGDDTWERFFSDMSWGLPCADIDTGNLAYIRYDLCKTLKQYLPKEQGGN